MPPPNSMPPQPDGQPPAVVGFAADLPHGSMLILCDEAALTDLLFERFLRDLENDDPQAVAAYKAMVGENEPLL